MDQQSHSTTSSQQSPLSCEEQPAKNMARVNERRRVAIRTPSSELLLADEGLCDFYPSKKKLSNTETKIQLGIVTVAVIYLFLSSASSSSSDQKILQSSASLGRSGDCLQDEDELYLLAQAIHQALHSAQTTMSHTVSMTRGWTDILSAVVTMAVLLLR